jgi:hypothetical protein
VLTPASLTAAFEMGEKIDNPLAMYLSDLYATPANLVSVRFMAPMLDELSLFRIGRCTEEKAG